MVEKEQKTAISWKQKIALVLFSTFLTIGMVALAGHFIQFGGESLNKKLVMKAWFLKNAWFGPQQIGIYQADPIYGWRHKPLSKGNHFEPYGFDVEYHIDEKGNRVTKGPYGRPEIVFLGCSFTFGHGVEDDENFPMLLSENFPSYKVVNGANNGWGTIQAWLRLKEELASQNDVRMVVYGFIGHHRQRNYLRTQWLDMLGKYHRQNVHVEAENGKIVLHGLSDMKKDGLSDDGVLVPKEKEITRLLIAEMKAACDEKNIPFLVAYLPDDKSHDFAAEILQTVGSEHFIDLRNSIDYDSINNGVDGHPTADGHRQIAEQLAPVIEKMLEQPIPVKVSAGTNPPQN
ncbi:MAG: hypothetical protein R2830_22295 [Saprospiraceae bacterium]